MKKILSLLLVAVMILSLCGCGIKITEQADINQVGDTTTSSNDYFKMTLTSAEIVDAVCLDKNNENFLLPISIEDAQNSPEYSMIKSLDHIILSYSFEYSFTGKNEVFEASVLGTPKVKYDDEYEFKQKYLNIVANSTNNMWLLHSSDCYDNALSTLPGMVDLIKVPETYTYQPLSENVYLVRGFIILPEKVATEGKTLSLEFSDFGQEYIIKQS